MLDRLYKEYKSVMCMSEEDACIYCNTDSKEDALQSIQDEIDYLESKDDDCSFGEATNYHLDEAFGSWEQVNRMFV